MNIKNAIVTWFSVCFLMSFMSCQQGNEIAGQDVVSPKESGTPASKDDEVDELEPTRIDNVPVIDPPGNPMGEWVAPIYIGGGGGGGRDDDRCPNDDKLRPGVCGCGVPDIDFDHDGKFDCLDNCPNIANSNQEDADEDGVGAACDCDDNNPDAGVAMGTSRYVSPSGSNTDNDCIDVNNPCLTIVYALSISDDNDTLFLLNGLFLESGIVINKDVKIYGAGSTNTTVNAQQNDRVFSVNENVDATFCGFTITGGYAQMNPPPNSVDLAAGSGGGILNRGNLLVSNCSIFQNTANIISGGVFNDFGSSMDIINSSIVSNTGLQSIGGFANYYTASMSIDNCVISDNIAATVGGAGGSAGHYLSVKNSVINDNSSPYIAGAIILVPGLSEVGTVEISGSQFSGNSSGFGGALVVNSGVATIRNSVFTGNLASDSGGALVSVDHGFAEVYDSTMANNIAAQNGGAIYLEQSATAYISGSTINNNSSTSGVGGGISAVQSSFANLINTTVSGNSSTTLGGGIHGTTFSSINVNNSTVAFNTATVDGGGIYKTSDVNLIGYHAIVSNNTINNCGANTGDVFNTADFSMFSDNSCTFSSGANNSSNVDPLLGPLQDNGGATKTHALSMASPAIDAGDTSCRDITDQRGEPRPVNVIGDDPIDAQNRCDIGSYEFQP